jgi:hypothetical protein
MKETRVTLPELAMIAGTRAIAGAGIGLLLANRLSESERRTLGWGLLAFGVLSTVPLAWEVFGKRQPLPPAPPGTMPRPEVGERSQPASVLART